MIERPKSEDYAERLYPFLDWSATVFHVLHCIGSHIPTCLYVYLWHHSGNGTSTYVKRIHIKVLCTLLVVSGGPQLCVTRSIIKHDLLLLVASLRSRFGQILSLDQNFCTKMCTCLELLLAFAVVTLPRVEFAGRCALQISFRINICHVFGGIGLVTASPL